MKVLRMIIRVSLVALLCIAHLPAANAQETDCQKCFKNTIDPTAHGGTDAQGRPIINIRIDNSFGNQTPENVWNGINGCKTAGCQGAGTNAVDNWNNAAGSPWAFQVSQDGQPTDITISKAGDGYKECGESRPLGAASTGKALVILPAASVNWTAEHIACVVSHEIGHILGLTQVDISCATSIMNDGATDYPDCACATPQIQAKDVNLVNIHHTPGVGPGLSCTIEAAQVAPFEDQGDGASGGGGGSGGCPPGDSSCCDPATDPACSDPCTDPSDTSCGGGACNPMGGGWCPPGETFNYDPGICECEPDGNVCVYYSCAQDEEFDWDICACVYIGDPWDNCWLDWDFCY